MLTYQAIIEIRSLVLQENVSTPSTIKPLQSESYLKIILIRDIHMLVQIDVGFIKETQLKAISL